MRVAWITRLALVLGVAFAAVLGAAMPAGAHPLGNFTTNRYARVDVGASVVRVHYVLDEAELVAFRQRDAIARVGTEAYLTARVSELRDGLRLSLDGDVVPLRPVVSKLAQPLGQGGLATLRIDVVFEAALPDVGRAIDVTFVDDNGAELLGWREVVVATSSGARLASTSGVPTTDRSDELRAYPSDPGVAPLDVRAARFEVTPGRGKDAPAVLGTRASADNGGPGTDRFVRVLGSTASSPIAVIGALLVAFAFGVVHALGPGHGKTVMAAYLVSTQGRRRDALALGAIVSLMHTASVLVLAGLLATVGRNLDAARLYPVLTLVAGVFVLGVGLRLVKRRWRSHQARAHAAAHTHHDHDHGSVPTAAPSTMTADGGGTVAVLAPPSDHADHHHDHGGHVHGPGGHTHELPPEVRPLSRAGLLALGTSGGLFPSPSAVVVLVGAFTVGRAALGLALIGAFSVGLAATLVAVGLLLVAGRDRLARSRFALQLPWLPLAGAAAIVVLGAVLVVQGIAELR